MAGTLNWRLRRLDRGVRARLSLLRMNRAPLLAPVTPLMQIEYRAGVDTRSLVVFLPGIGDLAEDFERHGFIHEMQRRKLRADAVAVDAHFGYYATRALFERVTDDVLDAAHKAGYHDIWLVGVSMGGFGAASYAALHAGRIRGLLMLAPYFGERALVQEIESAGGLREWTPAAPESHDYLRRLWLWLQQQVQGQAHGPSLFLGYGLQDKFARANSLLAQHLHDERVFRVPGGHDWRTWRKLWQLFLDRNPINHEGSTTRSGGGRAA